MKREGLINRLIRQAQEKKEAARLQAEEQAVAQAREAQRLAQEAKQKADAEAVRVAEAARLKAEAEARVKAETAARLKAEEDAMFATAKAAEEALKAAEEAKRTYVVKPGDSLSAIARDQLGNMSRWPEIYELNKDVVGDNPNLIQVGMKLILPR